MEHALKAYAFGLLVTLPAGIGLAFVVRHPGDPPHVYTFLAMLAVGLLALGALEAATERALPGWGMHLLGSVGLACYVVFVMLADPFIYIDGRTVAGLLRPATWLAPAILAGLWFARERRWIQALAAAVFVWTSFALMTFNFVLGFNLLNHDAASFLSKVRT